MRKPNSLSEILFMGCILLVVLVLVAAILFTTPTKAADIMPTVCRDTDYPAGIRYEFRNIPENWIDVTGYWYVADDGNMLQTNVSNTFVADALTSYPMDTSGIKVGEAVFSSGDSTIILRGTSDTFPCDQLSATTPEPTPCPAWAINGGTGELVCLWLLPEATNG